MTDRPEGADPAAPTSKRRWARLGRRAARGTAPPESPEVAARRAAVARVPDWFHSIDLGHGVVTPGNKSADRLAQELGIMDLGDLSGRSVLDIGAWDGFFSFSAERLGASRVVALDHYAWSLDLPAVSAYERRCREEGRAPEPWERVPEVWRPDTLPGKLGFDTARQVLDSRVEPVVGDFMTMDLEPLGRFDVVLFLGVLYHLQDPFVALRRLRQVTKDAALIETAVMVLVGQAGTPLWQLFPSDELDGDPGNWWAPNVAGLVGMCRAAGFREVDVLDQPPDDLPPDRIFHGRATVRALV